MNWTKWRSNLGIDLKEDVTNDIMPVWTKEESSGRKMRCAFSVMGCLFVELHSQN